MIRAARLPILALPALLLSGACGDPKLHLQLEIREPYRSEISSVAVQIIEPPVSAPFSCDDLAFARVDPAAIAFSRVGQVTTDALRSPIPDIDRTSRKLFWVDGLDERAERLVTGCTEVGVIDDDVDLQIIAEPVAHVVAPTGVSLSTNVGQPLSTPVAIPVKDALGAPLAGVAATWSVIGVAGSGATDRVTADPDGAVTFTPELPTRPGPFVLEVRVRWADGEPVLLSGVIAPMSRTLELPARALAYVKGRLGPNGEKGFAALVADPPNADRVVVGYRDATSGEIRTTSSPRIFGAPKLGVVEAIGQARDRVLAVSADAWNEVAPDGTLTSKPTYQPPAGATTPRRVLTTGPCAAASAVDQPEVLVEFAEGIVATYSLEAAQLDAFRLNDPADPTSNVSVVASGCVSDATNTPLRTLIFDFGGGIGVLAAVPAPASADLLVDSWLALGTGITFGPPGSDGRRLMFGTQLKVNDIVVSRASLARSDSAVTLVVEGSDSVAGVPDATAAGDLDGDGLVDAVSLFRRSTATGERPYAVWTVLGREHLGRRIAGDVNLGSPDLRSPALLLVDLDGDGSDDVVLAEQSAGAGGTATSRVEIYSMGGS